MANGSREWMWSEAMEMLARAERMHRRMFQPLTPARGRPTWEPPVDVMETESAVIVLVALPGVEPGKIDVSLDHDVLSLSGTRSFPREFGAALIHRLELPQGRFERHVSLPPGGYAAVRSTLADGRLTIVLEKLGALAGFCGPEGRTPRRVSAPSARLRLSVADEGRDNNSLSASTPTLTSRERGSFLE